MFFAPLWLLVGFPLWVLPFLHDCRFNYILVSYSTLVKPDTNSTQSDARVKREQCHHIMWIMYACVVTEYHVHNYIVVVPHSREPDCCKDVSIKLHHISSTSSNVHDSFPATSIYEAMTRSSPRCREIDWCLKEICSNFPPLNTSYRVGLNRWASILRLNVLNRNLTFQIPFKYSLEKYFPMRWACLLSQTAKCIVIKTHFHGYNNVIFVHTSNHYSSLTKW